MKNFGDMGKLLRQARKLQTDIAKAQEEVAQMTAEYAVGGGAVKAVVNGAHDLVQLKIDPAAVDPEDVEMLEDLVITAVNGALEEVRRRGEERMSQVTGGLGGMGLPGMPF